MKSQTNEPVKVDVVTVEALLDGADEGELQLDSYQRGFSWDERRMRQLVMDLERHMESDRSVPYYMGTILIHRKEGDKSHYVIDGQQRIAALSLLWHRWRNSPSPKNVNFTYAHKTSWSRLEAAYKVLEETWDEVEKDVHPDKLFARICVTRVITESEDDAFVFFDTQNSRGMPLEDTDLLKAYHLAAITSTAGAEAEDEQKREGAMRWEKQFRQGGAVSADRLFKSLLAPARLATGRRRVPSVQRRELLAEFRDGTYEQARLAASCSGKAAAPTPDAIPCFPSPFRSIHASIQRHEQRSWNSVVIVHDFDGAPLHYPFSLRQPLSKGMGFFLYTERYAELVRTLESEPADQEISILDLNRERDGCEIFRRLRWVLWSSQNMPYLSQVYLLAGLFYFDRFEDRGLGEFALRLEHILGSVRLKQDRLLQHHPWDALVQGCGDSGLGLLDVIAGSSIPDSVIDWVEREALRKMGNLKEPNNKWNGQQSAYLRHSYNSIHGVCKCPEVCSGPQNPLIFQKNKIREIRSGARK